MRLFLVLLALVLLANAQSEEFNEQDGSTEEHTVGNYGCTPKYGYFWIRPQWNCAYFDLHKNYRYYGQKDRCAIVNNCCFVDEKGDCGANQSSGPKEYAAGDARTGLCPSGFTRVTDIQECKTAPGNLRVPKTFKAGVHHVPLRTTENVHMACEHHNVPGVGCWFQTHPWSRYNGKKYFTSASCTKNTAAWAWFSWPLCSRGGSLPQPQPGNGCGYGQVAKHTYRAGDARTGSCPSGFTRVTDKQECQTAPGTLKVARTFNRYVNTVPLRTSEAVHIACEHHNVPGVGCWFITHPWPRYNGKKYFTEASCTKNNRAWAWFQYPLCKSVTASCATASSETEMETELSSSEALDMLMNNDSAESQSDESGIASAALPRLMEEEFSTEDDQE